MGNVSYLVEQNFKFTGEELRALIFGIVVMAIIFSFNEWGDKAFDLGVGLKNLFNALLIATLSLVVHHSMQRVAALYAGFKFEYRYWMYGLLIGLIVAFVSRGNLMFLAPGGIIAYHMAGHRLGAFRYGLNYWNMALAVLSGPLANIALAVIFKLLLYVFPHNVLLSHALVFNLLLAVFTMLPIPPLDGSHLMFASRLTYAFTYGAMLGMSAVLYFLGIGLALLVGILIGAIVWASWYFVFEAG